MIWSPELLLTACSFFLAALASSERSRLRERETHTVSQRGARKEEGEREREGKRESGRARESSSSR